jgi:hypothetical protein
MSLVMRRSTVYLLLFAALAVHAHWSQGRAAITLRPCIEQVQAWGLTDLCLFTEARYTRHPAMADTHAAFQDHPMALEHFPSGALVAPPARLHVRVH